MREDVPDALDAIAPPPPFALRSEDLATPSSLPLGEEASGRLKIDRHGRLLKTYFDAVGINPFIKDYSNWIQNELPKQIAGPYEFSGIFKPFYTFRVVNPRVTREKFGSDPITPQQARLNSRTYSIEIKVDVVMDSYISPPDPHSSEPPRYTLASIQENYERFLRVAMENRRTGNVYTYYKKDVTACKIPLMLGCVPHCALAGKSADELVRLGESPADPLGYFIVNGKSKGINLPKGLRFDIFIISQKNKEEELNCKMTCSTLRGTFHIKSRLGENDTGVDINLQFMRDDKNSPIYFTLWLVAEALWSRMTEDVFTLGTLQNFIEFFISKPMDKLRSRKILNGMISPTKENWTTLRKILQRYGNKDLTEAEVTRKVVDRIVDETFPQMSVDKLAYVSEEELNLAYMEAARKKFYMVCFMTARLIEYHLGSRDMDDIDDWGNIKVESPAELIKQLFAYSWKSTIDSAMMKIIKKENLKNTIITPDLLGRYIETEKIIDESFRTSLSSSDNWGVPGDRRRNTKGYKKSNIANQLESTTAIPLLSQLTKIVTVVDANSTNKALRAVQQSQFGYADPVESPESKKCGLNVHKAITARITTYRDPSELIRLIKARVLGGSSVLAQDKSYTWTFYVNDILVGGTEQEAFADLYGKVATMYVQRYPGMTFAAPIEGGKGYLKITYPGDPNAIIQDLLKEQTGGDRIFFNDPVAERQVLIINGRFIGWCRGPEVVSYVKEIRKDVKQDYTDLTVWFESADNTVYIYTNEGRLIRPLLVLDEYEDPIVAKKDLWEADFETLLKEGAVEYIDVKENNTLLVASSLDFLEYRKGSKDIREVVNDISLLEAANPEEELPEGLSQIAKSIVGYGNLRLYKIEKEEEDEEEKKEVLETNTRNLKTLLARLKAYQESFLDRQRYTHLEYSPDALFGFSVSLNPYAGHTPAPRHTIQSSMNRQAMTYTEGKTYHMDSSKSLMAPTPPMVMTQTQEILGLGKIGYGQTVMVMFLPSENLEDAIVFNQRSLELGKFRMVIHHVYEADKIDRTGIKVEFGKPEPNKYENKHIYDHLNSEGLPRIGTKLRVGDVVIGKIAAGNPSINKSVRIRPGEDGVVESVVRVNEQGNDIVRVKVRKYKIPEIGDKFAARYAQKGTIGRTRRYEDMPYVYGTGETADVVINPHSIPSRMTIGMLMEMIAGTYSHIVGEKQDATMGHKIDEAKMMNALMQYGYSRQAKVKVVNPETGVLMKGMVSFGPVYYLALKHIVQEKIQARGRSGDIDPLTRMPVKSRQRKGGLRVGGMELNALIMHGVSAFTQQRMCHESNPINLVLCKRCGKENLSVPDAMYRCETCGLNTGGDGFTKATIRYTTVYIKNLLTSAGVDVRYVTREG